VQRHLRPRLLRKAHHLRAEASDDRHRIRRHADGIKPVFETRVRPRPHFDRYRTLYEENHHKKPLSPVCVDFLSCDESAEVAEANARQYMANYYITVMEHYEMAGEHFKRMKGYGDYANNAVALRESGMADAANAFVDINTFGTPRQIIEKMEQRRRQIGDFDLTVQVSYGGLTGEQAEKSIRLFAKEVLPEIQSWQTR